jgi:hypothetical protein
MPIKNYKSVKKCDEDFEWAVPFDFIKEGDTAKTKITIGEFYWRKQIF